MLLGGKYQTYIRKGYGLLIACGLIILFALIGIEIHNIRNESTSPMRYTTLLGYFILVFPILLVIAVKPGNLSTFAAASRGISTSLTGQDNNLMDVLKSQITTEEGFRKLNIKQILVIAKQEPEKIEGLQISTEGFAYYEPTQPPGSFMLVRFLITCCAADATPLGIEVRTQKTVQFPPDTWVKVQGTAKMENNKPIITQSIVTPVSKPSNVYLY